NLYAVGILGYQPCALFVHGLGYDGEPGFLPGNREELETQLSQALERVGRAARLEGSATQGSGTCCLHGAGSLDDLLLALYRTRAGDDRHFVSAKPNTRLYLNDGILGAPLARYLLVRTRDGNHLCHTRHSRHTSAVHLPVVAHETYRGALRSRERQRLVPHCADCRADCVHLHLRCITLPYNPHASRRTR